MGNKMKNWFLLACIVFFPLSIFACTEFSIGSEDNARVVGRSLEFAPLLTTQIQIVPKGKQFQSTAPNNQKGMGWTNPLAYISLVVQPANSAIDGFNEKGLSIGALWFPGTQYPQDPKNAPEKTVSVADVGSWILGNFSSVQEAKEALSKIQIYTAAVPGFAEMPPIHLSLQDASGQAAVLEFIDGKMQLFDNPIGVLTNAPDFPWQLTNLRNYINLTALNAQPIKLDGTVLGGTGQGSGLLGIPGDWTPPSRFVRIAIYKQALAKPKNAQGAVLAAVHLLNSVDIPYGTIRAFKDRDYDYTQWIVIKDLTNKQLYYRTYGDQTIRKVDFAANLTNPQTIPIANTAP